MTYLFFYRSVRPIAAKACGTEESIVKVRTGGTSEMPSVRHLKSQPLATSVTWDRALPIPGSSRIGVNRSAILLMNKLAE